jgi:hypothetical protein
MSKMCNYGAINDTLRPFAMFGALDTALESPALDLGRVEGGFKLICRYTRHRAFFVKLVP